MSLQLDKTWLYVRVCPRHDSLPRHQRQNDTLHFHYSDKTENMSLIVFGRLNSASLSSINCMKAETQSHRLNSWMTSSIADVSVVKVWVVEFKKTMWTSCFVLKYPASSPQTRHKTVRQPPPSCWENLSSSAWNLTDATLMPVAEALMWNMWLMLWFAEM